MPALPARPSIEHLRKQAKRRARQQVLTLAAAQRSVANDYGFGSWSELVRHVEGLVGPDSTRASSPLFAAVRSGNVEAVQRLLAGGSNPRIGDGRETALHVAARYGPPELVETLIAGGAFEWQTDTKGRTPLDVARRGRTRDRPAIVAFLDRPSTADPSFRAAIDAIRTGDVDALAALLDAEPRLLRERIVEPQAYRMTHRHQYFRDPKLLWFVANNPALVARMPNNIVEVAHVMIERGVERADLDYTIELVMSSRAAREAGHQRTLMRALIDAGGTPTRQAILVCAGNGELDALRLLLEAGQPMDAPIAAALDARESLRELLPRATRSDVQTAFGLAVINANAQAAELALDAGADVDAFLPVHAHSTALHQAVLGGRSDLIELLLARGARTDVRDTLWDATPLNWAIHQKVPLAEAILRNAMTKRDDR